MFNKIKKLWGIMGPGITTGAADDDPSGIATYSQTGAQFGFKFLWLAPYSFVLMGVVQEMCARIALVTGKGLAENIRNNFSRKWLYFCGFFVILANTLNIGADIGAMAEVVAMFVPDISLWVPIITIAVITILLEVFLTYDEYSKYLKILAMTLLAYIFTGLLLSFDFSDLIYSTLVPSISFDRDSIIIIAAILGTTISPYLFFWQTSQEVEDEISKGNTSVESRQRNGPNNITNMRIDVWGGMFFSNVVMFFIIAVCAGTLFKSGIHNIQSASQAAEALRPLAGDFSYILFAFGIISTGFLAIPVLAASSAYIFAETFSFKEGLYRKAKDAKVFYLIIILSVAFGLLFNLIGLNPITALVYTSVANAVVSPIALVFIIILASKDEVMGVYKNGLFANIAGWFTAILMMAVGVAAIYYIL
jgi:NRAMP (natural resistance-associated macrophage protein)-like metal ion transporter